MTISVKGKDDSKAAFDSATSNTKKLSSATEGAKTHLSLFKVAAGAVAGSGLVKFLGDSIAEARESQKVNAQTAAVLKSTGGAAKITAGQIGDLANKISLKTGIDDEQIQSSENMLLTFTNVRNEVGKGNDVFSQATQVVTDMSVALGQDSKNSAIQLGKALNDPIKGITALQRVGVTFTEQQKAQIATMVKSGHTLDAQKVILKELTKEFGGSAAAQATAGEKAKVAWKNVEEQVGTALLPVLDKLGTFVSGTLMPKFSAAVTWIQAHWPQISHAIADSYNNYIKPILTTLVNFIQNQLIPAFMAIANYIGGHTDQVKAFAGAFIALFVAMKAYGIISSVTTAVRDLNAAMKANVVLVVVAALAALVTWFIISYKTSEKFRDTVNHVLDNLSHAWGNFAHAVDNAKHAWDNFVHALDNVKHAFDNFLHAMGNIQHAFENVSHAADNVTHAWGNVLNFLASSVKFVGKVAGAISNAFMGVGNGLVWAWNHTIGPVINAIMAAVRAVQNAINALSRTKVVTGTGTYGGPFGSYLGQAFATGGPIGGGYATTDERGPEIKRYPNGTMVYPAGQSAQMASQWGNSGGAVTVSFDFGGADSALVELFRKAVRVRGGNVQATLGTG